MRLRVSPVNKKGWNRKREIQSSTFMTNIEVDQIV
jgi:hypothetical protein